MHGGANHRPIPMHAGRLADKQRSVVRPGEAVAGGGGRFLVRSMAFRLTSADGFDVDGRPQRPVQPTAKRLMGAFLFWGVVRADRFVRCDMRRVGCTRTAVARLEAP